MNDLLKLATLGLERFLAASLPKLAEDWWPKHVLNLLSFQQQRFAQERHQTSLRDFDFAALLECSGSTEPSIDRGTMACDDSKRRRDGRRRISVGMEANTHGGDA